MSLNRPPYIEDLAKLVESEPLSKADLQLIESTIECLTHYFLSRTIEARGMNQVIDIQTGKVLSGDGKTAEQGADLQSGLNECFSAWTNEDVRIFDRQMQDFSGREKAVMRIFFRFSIGKKINTASLYEVVREKKDIIRPRSQMLITRDQMVSTINKCGMKKFFGTEGPFILKRNKPLGDKKRDDLNPLVFWIEKV